ncbi:MAG TPA: zinc ribbon domain-containing protein [Actinomycetota bacterium]|nr:zinc ribbon domain-containing protein [Actinomycetota bacterium]
MPLYEYSCAECGERFDRLQGRSDAHPSCPHCGGATVRRVISLIAGLGGSSAMASSGCGCGGACACGRG